MCHFGLPILDGNSAGFESIARKLTARTMGQAACVALMP